MVQMNLLDALEILLFIAVVYRGYKSGFFTELFRLISVILAVVIATHYYARFGSLLTTIVFLKPHENLIAFTILALGFSMLFPSIRNGWVNLMHVEPHPPIKSWLFALMAALRGYLIAAMVFFAMAISNNDYFLNSAKTSLSKFIFKDVGVDIYQLSYDGVIKRLFSAEPFNDEALQVGKNLEGPEKEDTAAVKK